MNEQTQAAIRAHAVACFPAECCGVVAIIKGKERYLECRNINAGTMTNFGIHPEDWAKAHELGEIVAIVHSHPNDIARPSEGDRVMMELMELPWHIVHVSKLDGYGEVTATYINTFEPDGYVAPLVGRAFLHGVLDCYSLIKDWYERERGIVLPHFERQDKWWEDGVQDLYMQHFADAGFAPIVGPIQVGDVPIMQLGNKAKRPNHAGVYIGDGQILHHMYGRLSTRDAYLGQFREVTRVIVRHRELQNG